MLFNKDAFRYTSIPRKCKSIHLIISLFLQQVKSQDIHVGDIVRVKRDESFPCDLVLISTSNSEGKCYITTANLDGETNLKVIKFA